MFKKIFTIILMFSLIISQEPCEGTCLSEKETKDLFNNIQECEFDKEKYLKLNENLNSQIYMYIQKDSLNISQIEDYMRLIKLKDEMIKVVKPKWYENKWLWFTFGVVATAGSIKLAGEIVD